MRDPLTPEEGLQRETMRTTLMLQIGGTILTIVGLTFTITAPLFTRIDNLTLAIARMEESSKAAVVNQAALERRLSRIETDLYTLQTKSDANTDARLKRN